MEEEGKRKKGGMRGGEGRGGMGGVEEERKREEGEEGGIGGKRGRKEKGGRWKRHEICHSTLQFFLAVLQLYLHFTCCPL